MIKDTEKKPLSFQGGLSRDVAKHWRFRQYVSSGRPAGYIGNGNRTRGRDIVLENMLRKRGLGDGAIADWLTSNDGRHLMDDVDQKMTNKAFMHHARPYVERAFIMEFVWNHPDQGGNLLGTRRVQKALRDWLVKQGWTPPEGCHPEGLRVL